MDKFVVRHSAKPKLSVEETKQVVANRDGALIEFYPSFMEPTEAHLLFKELKNLAGWHIGETITRGGLKKTPRLIMGLLNPLSDTNFLVTNQQAYGALKEKDEELDDHYKEYGTFPPLLMKAHDKIRELTGETFNFAYLNYYRNGDDHIGFHADKEETLETGSTIASLSLGETRDFNIRHIGDTRLAQNMSDSHLRKEALEKAKTTVSLKAGSLLLMKHRTQKVYHHQVPKRANCKGVRINITFRHIRDLSTLDE